MSQERRRALIISCGIMSVAAVGVVAVIATSNPKSPWRFHVPPATVATSDSDLSTAVITIDSDDKGCWRQVFDNRTGRLTRSPQPCEKTAYDSSGAPIPLGTIHRLDAISKSFSGR
jgi:hypothetical protein